MDEDEDELLCTCGDPMWLIQMHVGNQLVDEYLVDVVESSEAAMQAALELSERHIMIANLTNEPWRAGLSCPTCGAGVQITPEGIMSIAARSS